MSITFWVPTKPVSVNRARAFATGFRKSPEAIAYQQMVAFYGKNARALNRHETWNGPVEVEFRFFYASNRADNDGPQKLTQDALALVYGKGGKAKGHQGAGFFVNDKQVVSTKSTKVVGEIEGVEITVREATVVDQPLPAAAQNTLDGLKRLGSPKRRPNLVSSRKDYR